MDPHTSLNCALCMSMSSFWANKFKKDGPPGRIPVGPSGLRSRFGLIQEEESQLSQAETRDIHQFFPSTEYPSAHSFFFSLSLLRLFFPTVIHFPVLITKRLTRFLILFPWQFPPCGSTLKSVVSVFCCCCPSAEPTYSPNLTLSDPSKTLGGCVMIGQWNGAGQHKPTHNLWSVSLSRCSLC